MGPQHVARLTTCNFGLSMQDGFRMNQDQECVEDHAHHCHQWPKADGGRHCRKQQRLIAAPRSTSLRAHNPCIRQTMKCQQTIDLSLFLQHGWIESLVGSCADPAVRCQTILGAIVLPESKKPFPLLLHCSRAGCVRKAFLPFLLWELEAVEELQLELRAVQLSFMVVLAPLPLG